MSKFLFVDVNAVDVDITVTADVIAQAFIIGWTSEFIPKMVYQQTDSPHHSLAGYNNWSLSIFDVNDFQNRSIPDDVDPSFGDVMYCRYKDFRHPPGGADEYKYTATYWHVFCARLAFVIVFEVRLADTLFACASRLRHRFRGETTGTSSVRVSPSS